MPFESVAYYFFFFFHKYEVKKWTQMSVLLSHVIDSTQLMSLNWYLVDFMDILRRAELYYVSLANYSLNASINRIMKRANCLFVNICKCNGTRLFSLRVTNIVSDELRCNSTSRPYESNTQIRLVHRMCPVMYDKLINNI